MRLEEQMERRMEVGSEGMLEDPETVTTGRRKGHVDR